MASSTTAESGNHRREFYENEAFKSDGDGGVQSREIPAAPAAASTNVEAPETTDAYEEMATLRVDAAGRPWSAPAPQTRGGGRRRRVGISATPELLETLQRLKRPAGDDSDESAACGTDCGGGARPHRRVSSLLSGADDGACAFYAPPPPPRPPPPLQQQLLSAPDLSRLRRISRQSLAGSDAVGSVVGGGGGGWRGADRKAAAAARAVRLDYQFVTSSAKQSLQKVGQRSLTQLEDLARIGHAEQGTNYKRSYVSLYSPLRPVFLTLKLFGVFHTRQKGGGAALKFTNSYVYSGLVLLAAWFNAIRFFFVYDWGQEKFDSLLFFKMTQHAVFIQTAVAASVMFRASGEFPRFFRACHEFMGKRHSLAYASALNRRSKAIVMLGSFVMLAELSTYLSWAVRADSDLLRTFQRPYTILVPWTDASRAALTCLSCLFNAFSAAAWVFPALLFCSFTWIFEREFRSLAHRLRLACTNDHIFVGDIERFRVESWRISKLIAKLDELFNFYVFILFLTDVLSVCLILYNLVVGQYPNDGSLILAWFWLLSALLRLFGVTISAAKVNQAACSPLIIIQNMNLKDYAVNPAKIGQLMIFLNKLTIGNIGFTAWNLFTLSRTSTLTIATMILSYTLLFVKLGASYGQDDRLRTRAIGTTASSLDGVTASTMATNWSLTL